MPVTNINEPAATLFSTEQKDEREDGSDPSIPIAIGTQDYRIEQLNLALEDYKKNYSEFIDIAIHDLHAPIRKLSILTEMLTAKYADIAQNDAQAQEWITRINGCLTDLRLLIDGLSELANATADSMKYTSCDLSDLIKEVLSELEPAIKEKGAVIIKSNLPIIEGDTIQLKQLFKNILDNAIRFSKKDISPEITISSQTLTDEEKNLLELPQARQYYKIDVSDNGIGFKQEYAQKIFQPFIRLNGKSAFPGSGLGLAICKRIVDNHRGILFAESIENNSTRFTLILPEIC